MFLSFKLTVFIVVVALISVGCTNAQSVFWGQCTQSEAEQAFSAPIKPILFGVTGSMGLPGYCDTYASQFCVFYPRMYCVPKDRTKSIATPLNNNCGNPVGPSLGMCVPKAEAGCNSSVLTAQAKYLAVNVTLGDLSATFQKTWGFGGSCNAVPLSDSCGPESYAYLEADCPSERKGFESDPRAVGVFAFVLILGGMCVACTGAVLLDDHWHTLTELVSCDDDGAYVMVDVPPRSSTDATSLLVNNVATPARRAEPQKRRLLSPTLRHWAEIWDLISGLSRFFTAGNRGSGDIDTRFLEGVRTIAMLFVIYGHSLFFPLFSAGFNNILRPYRWISTYSAMVFFPSMLAVDTFFYLSGFLFMHLYMRAVEKDRDDRAAKLALPTGAADVHGGVGERPLSILKTALMILHRWLRLTPVVMTTLIVSSWLLPYLTTHEVMFRTYRDNVSFATCATQWWHQMLYITNMKEEWSECQNWMWFLSADFQLFLAATVLAPLWYVERRLFFVTVLGLIAMGVALQAKDDAYQDMTYYNKPWVRCAPYLYGFVCAIIVRNESLRHAVAKRSVRFWLYLIGCALMVSVINIMWRTEAWVAESVLKGHPKEMHHQQFNHFSNGWAEFAWGLGLSCFSVIYTTPHGGVVKRFLSHAVFQVTAKLTFTCYMLHPIILMAITAAGYDYPYFTPLALYWTFGAAVSWSFFGALVLYLVVEWPAAMLNNMLTKRLK